MQIRWMTLFLDFPADDFPAGADFWRQVTATQLSPLRGPALEFATLLPERGDAYLRVQKLGSGEARCHLDLHLPQEELPDATSRATALGATLQHHEDGFDVLASPGGYPFCLVAWEGEQTVPPPHAVAGAEGLTRLDQLCLDIPPALWDSETTFWAELTGWELQHDGESEFARLGQPGDLPVRLLLQRLDDDAPAVTSHPDFAAPQRFSLAPAHAALGATAGPANEQWSVMTDPRGRVYCLTGRPV